MESSFFRTRRTHSSQSFPSLLTARQAQMSDTVPSLPVWTISRISRFPVPKQGHAAKKASQFVGPGPLVQGIQIIKHHTVSGWKIHRNTSVYFIPFNLSSFNPGSCTPESSNPVSPRASRLHAAAVIPMTCLNCFEKYAASGYPTSCPMVFT